MGFYAGRRGELIFDSKPVAKIRDWSLETTVELISTNAIDSKANTFTPGIKGATGSATLIYYRLEAGESATKTEFTALLAKIMHIGGVNSTHRVLLTLNAGADNSLTPDDIQFYAYITSAQIGVSAGELTTVPIQFTVDGDYLDVITATI